jgi:glucose-1-phosphate cytidylyltransferase
LWRKNALISTGKTDGKELSMDAASISNASPQVKKVLQESPLVIFCGGQGTRLREETEWKPKPMVPVGEWPLLWHIMRYYSCFGTRRFVLCLGYRGELIREFFLNYHRQWANATVRLGRNSVDYAAESYIGDDWEIVLANTGVKTMTGGRLAAVAKYLDSENFLLTYGDGLSDVDLNALVDFHLKGGRVATLTAVRPVSRFGELVLDPAGKVERYAEKPVRAESWINGGFFVCTKEVMHYLPKEDVYFESSPLLRLAEDGQLGAYQHTGFWQCVDTYRELVLVDKLWQQDEAPWKIW